MKEYHVVMPVEGYINVDSRFNTVLDFLSAQNAHIHLVTVLKETAAIHSDTILLHKQQQQIGRMAKYLKFELLDQIAQSMQASHPSLTFELHVETDAFSTAVAKLRDQFDMQLLMVDQTSLLSSKHNENSGSLSYLLSMTDLPIWMVASRGAASGNVMVAVDVPTQNLQLDHLNRSLIRAAADFSDYFDSEVYLTHSWQLSNEDFMRKWLRLTDIDIARFGRVERQQREASLAEYLGDIDDHSRRIHIKVLEGSPATALAKMTERLNTRLLVIGHNQNPYGSMGHVAEGLLAAIQCDTVVLPRTPFAQSAFHWIQPTLTGFNQKMQS